MCAVAEFQHRSFGWGTVGSRTEQFLSIAAKAKRYQIWTRRFDRRADKVESSGSARFYFGVISGSRSPYVQPAGLAAAHAGQARRAGRTRWHGGVRARVGGMDWMRSGGAGDFHSALVLRPDSVIGAARRLRFRGRRFVSHCALGSRARGDGRSALDKLRSLQRRHAGCPLGPPVTSKTGSSSDRRLLSSLRTVCTPG